MSSKWTNKSHIINILPIYSDKKVLIKNLPKHLAGCFRVRTKVSLKIMITSQQRHCHRGRSTLLKINSTEFTEELGQSDSPATVNLFHSGEPRTEIITEIITGTAHHPTTINTYSACSVP